MLFGESVLARAIFASIHKKGGKTYGGFSCRTKQRGGTATIFGSAIDWLYFAGVVLKCGRIEQGFMPISVYSDLASFKLYMSDVGLLTMKSGISQQAVLTAGEIDNTFLGAITENYVAQVFAAKEPIVTLDGCNYLNEEMVKNKWAHFRLNIAKT